MASPTETQVIPTPVLLTGLTDLLGTHGPFNAMTLHLYQNNIVLGRSTVLSNLTEANFTGYAAVASYTWSTPYVDVDGSALAIGADEAFIATAATPSNQVYGYYFTDSGATMLLAAYAFAAPVAIAGIGQAVTVVPFMRYSGT